MQDKIFFKQSQFFFLQYVSLTFFIYVPAGFGKILLALVLGGTSKSRVFEKTYISVFSIRTPVKDAGFI